MKYLVVGCNGMAGHIISLYLKEKGHDVIGYARSKNGYVNTIIGDIHNLSLLASVISDGDFNAIVNCVGILNQFAEERKDEAVFVNSYFPHWLAKITENTSTQVIHLSTDCVFSGKKGNYTEEDFPDGQTIYDRTKALGELNNQKDITLRNSIVGPDIKESGIGLLNWFMKQEGTISGYTEAIWTGQTTLQLAKTIEVVSMKKASGLVNMVPNESISKFNLLKLFNKYLRNDSVEILPNDKVKLNKSLIRTNYQIDYTIPNYDIMIYELSVWMKEHDYLYPHYKL